jgi:hypothetical protein
MTNNDFHKTITVNASPEEVIEKISQVNLGWAKDFTGGAAKLNDKFNVRFGETFVDFQIVELKPSQKVVWKVSDCNLHWINNKKEWNNTQVVFEILSTQDGRTKIDFTHVGLVPGFECFDNCKVGWTEYVTQSLPKFIEKGIGLPK